MAVVLKEEITQVFCVHGSDTEDSEETGIRTSFKKDKLCSLYLAYRFTSFPFLEFSYASASGQNRLLMLMKRSHPWTPPCPSSWTEPWPPRRGSGQGCSCWEHLQLLCEHILWLMWHILISNICPPFFSPSTPPSFFFSPRRCLRREVRRGSGVPSAPHSFHQLVRLLQWIRTRIRQAQQERRWVCWLCIDSPKT